MRARMRCWMKGAKNQTWSSYVGYSRDDIVSHLERQFARGMSWENYGKEWEVDHILPLSSFDMGDPEQVKFAWALANLRPLWKVLNRQKKDKRLFLI